MVVDFAKKAAVNMYFNKREAHGHIGMEEGTHT